MKKTTYAIIAGVAVLFALGLGLTAYMAANARPYIPMSERVEMEWPDDEDAAVDTVVCDTVAIDSIL